MRVFRRRRVFPLTHLSKSTTLNKKVGFSTFFFFDSFPDQWHGPRPPLPRTVQRGSLYLKVPPQASRGLWSHWRGVGSPPFPSASHALPASRYRCAASTCEHGSFLRIREYDYDILSGAEADPLISLTHPLYPSRFFCIF